MQYRRVLDVSGSSGEEMEVRINELDAGTYTVEAVNLETHTTYRIGDHDDAFLDVEAATLAGLRVLGVI